MRESDLYAPVKAFLVAQGYEVKAEIGDCDLLARRGDEPPVVVELKRGFTLALVLQGVARQSLFEHVYLAVPVAARSGWPRRYKDIVRLCRRLGLGLLAVRPGPPPLVEPHLDPGPYAPRRNASGAGRLLREFDRRVGDHNTGGSSRVKRVTAYRQDALRCAALLRRLGPTRAAEIASATAVPRAARLMRDDHYGWFDRVSRGVYSLSPKGLEGLTAFAAETDALSQDATSESRPDADAPAPASAPAAASAPGPTAARRPP